MPRYKEAGWEPSIHYDTGHPTLLQTHKRLGAMVAEHGEPSKITRRGRGWHLEWWPLYPGLPTETYYIQRDPWNDGRTVTRVSARIVWKQERQTLGPAPHDFRIITQD